MVKQLKEAGKTANETIHKVFVVAALASGIAAAAKLATEPMVSTGFGRELPVWQAVATVLLVLAGTYIWNLESKKG